VDVTDIIEKIDSALGRKGFKAGILSIDRLPDLKADFERAFTGAGPGPDYYWRSDSYFSFSPPESLPGAKSIIVATAPQPRLRVRFHLDGWEYGFMVPPTYDYGSDDVILETMRELLSPAGYGVTFARLPDKLTAVRSGLAAYGRNNVTYIDGMGSFHRLRVYYSNLPADDNWREPALLDACRKCSACVRGCPAKAIDPERFLVDVGRCITYYNEGSGDFPEWIEPAWHNCLIGCMKCQLVCPENAPFVDWIEDSEDFSEEETRLILEGESVDNLPAETANKLRRLYLYDDYDIVPRNLKILIETADSAR
jgi:epoxyqueuosine reductase